MRVASVASKRLAVSSRDQARRFAYTRNCAAFCGVLFGWFDPVSLRLGFYFGYKGGDRIANAAC